MLIMSICWGENMTAIKSNRKTLLQGNKEIGLVLSKNKYRNITRNQHHNITIT